MRQVGLGLVLAALVYAVYAIFPFGLLADIEETGDGQKMAVLASDPAQKKSGAVVVELFTSQGCYSCPPAEAFLRELAVRPDVIALEFHVDYWDDLVYGAAGKWKDPFSSPQATLRQANYNEAIRGTPKAYTPQIIVDGHLVAIGSRRNAVGSAIKKASDKLRYNLRVTVDSHGSLSSDISGTYLKPLDIWFVRLLKRRVTQVHAGENKGKTLASYNIVRQWQRIGTWSGETAPLKKQVTPLAPDETCAVLMQDADTQRIFAAGFCQNITG